jgi:drug/metabolite transporter (DMT)-like permease
MLLAQFFGTLMNVTTRLLEVEGNLGKGLHPFNILFVRMGITVVLASLYMWYNKTPHFPFGHPEVRWLLVARGFGGFFGVTGMYWSLLYLPLADATVITFLAPGLACWACSFLINEPFTRVEKIGTLVSFVGVIFIARPTSFFAAFSSAPPGSGTGDMAPENTSTPDADASNYDDVTPSQRLMAVGIALVGVCGACVAYTTIRWIGKRAHPLISVNYFATWCTIVSFVLQLALPHVGFVFPADAKEWGYLIFLGICGFVMVSRCDMHGM